MKRRDWQAHLTSAERKQMALIKKKIKDMEDKTSILRMRWNKIQNRATARAREK